MRRLSLSRDAGVAGAVAFVAGLFVADLAPQPCVAQVFSFAVGAAQNESEADTTEAAEEPKEKKGSLSIRIDESGFRIEGLADEGDTLGATQSDRRIIFDGRAPTARRYREKGTDIVKFGEDVYVSSNELVRGDIVVFGGDVTIEGKIVGNVVVMAGDAEIRSGAEINGDMVVLGGALYEEPEVLIHGERVEFQDIGLSMDGLSGILGAHGRFFEFFFIPVQFFISIILSFLIILFLRERIEKSHEMVLHSFLKSFGAGFLVVLVGSFLVAFLSIILLITLIGIPLALVLLVSCLAVFIISRTVFVYALGSLVNEKLKIQTANPFAVVLVGTAALYLPALVGYGVSLWPFGGSVGALFKFLGMLVSIFAYLVGLGALFLSRFGNRGIDVAQSVPAAATTE